MTSNAAELSYLSYARYGKTSVRVFRIVREGKWHHTVEYNVETLLEGDIETSYTEADNSVVVATDSVKNITYYLAKVSPHILNAEKFALHIGTFFVSKYAHIHKAHVTVEQLRWKRISINGEEHPHSFYRDGDDKRVVKAVVDATAGKHALVANVSSGLVDLLVLKSSGSAFENFWTDEYTTLVPVDDRIFSTSVDLSYTFKGVKLVAPQDDKKLEFQIPLNKGDEGYDGSVWDEDVPKRTRDATLQIFALDESASVQDQATLYKMAQRIIAENGGIQDVTYTLPNKHYIPVDMRYIGVDNLTPDVASTSVPLSVSTRPRLNSFNLCPPLLRFIFVGGPLPNVHVSRSPISSKERLPASFY
ncbi:uricase [Coprinopsis cinerea okayama7|uniref:factor independent urate hydroxylase n=1 Tax=Coprinopsis cinerea (strain Okayama-7 / 130 / ATCC MYA-4618 / FGSC 9003) TaxID=240176 RepID=A8NVS5_COPC7|nr:uricase [Coprinopsis cinerea okayama7\|eukprot:XP_001836745.2 uricase [Coprinopsis cinerea okayama7\